MCNNTDPDYDLFLPQVLELFTQCCLQYPLHYFEYYTNLLRLLPSTLCITLLPSDLADTTEEVLTYPLLLFR